MANTLADISKVIDTKMILPLQKNAIGRKLMGVNGELSGKGVGMESVDIWSLSDIADATIAMGLPDQFGDTADITSDTLNIPILSEPFNIPRRMYESYKLKGINIDTHLATLAAFKVQEKEEALLLNGWAPDGTNYLIDGLYQAANNAEATASDFGTYGNASKKVQLAKTLLENDTIYGPYNLVLNTAQYNELLNSETTTGTEEWAKVLKLLNDGQDGGPAQIFSSTVMTAGTGMMLPVADETYFDIVEPQRIKSELNEKSELGSLSPLFGMILESLAPRVKIPNAVCTLTNI